MSKKTSRSEMVSVRITKEMKEKLLKVAKEDDRTMGYILFKIVEEAVKTL
ncbi:MAG: Arc family DNA-binding protein [Clostridia bacterium]